MAITKDITTDPEFQALPFEEKRKFLQLADVEFSALPDVEQHKFMNAAGLNQPLVEKPIREEISKTARPILEVGGGVTGAALATPETLGAGTAIGGALGFAGGKATADLLDRGMGLKKPISGAKEALAETVGDVGYGASMQLLNGATEIALAKGPQVARQFLIENFPKVAQTLTGVQKKYFARVLANPKILLPKSLGGPASLDEAGAAMGKAEESAFGAAAKPTAKEINDPALSTARENAITAAESLNRIKENPQTIFVNKKGVAYQGEDVLKDPETGAMILKGKRGTRAQIDMPSTKGSQKALLHQQEEELSKILEQYYPDVRKASGDYAESKAREQAMKLLPVLKNGDPSYMRIVLSALGRGVGMPFGMTVPAVNAVAGALAKLSIDGLEKVAAVPLLRQYALTEIARRQGNEPNR
jgi:hypothetical protein